MREDPPHVYSLLTSAEIAECAVLTGHARNSSMTIRLLYTLQSREATLRRLYNAVMATPVESTELRAAMREVEKALGISPQGNPDTGPYGAT